MIAGSRCAIEAFALTDPDVSVVWLLPDGSRVSAGDEIAVVEGPLAPILTAERTALNFLCHLSGVATLTRAFVDAVDRRQPRHAGPRHAEDHAGPAFIREGGSARGRRFNHRGSLSEAVMVKDNHLAGIAISDAVANARRLWPGRMVEVECESPDQVIEAVDAGASVVMLDNMKPRAGGRMCRHDRYERGCGPGPRRGVGRDHDRVAPDFARPAPT